MSSSLTDGEVTSPIAAAHDVLDDVFDTAMDLWTVPELLENWRELDRLRNREAALEHRFIHLAEQWGLPADAGAKSTAAFVRGLLRLEPHEASARVRAAAAGVGRTTPTGEQTPAPYPAVGDAQAAGTISPRHASLIVRTVETLPEDAKTEHGIAVEAELVELATRFDPVELGKLATRVTQWIDPDGVLKDVAYRDKHRDLSLHKRTDGSSTLTGDLTAELTEIISTAFDALAKPKPETDGVKDPRTAGQRNHDALIDILSLVTRAELLPDAGGITSTVLLTTTKQAWESGEGLATTGHGAVLPVREAIRIAGSHARIMTVQFDAFGAITNWTDARRVHTQCQRLALIARDGGCTFPGCDAPPAWCQAAHITDHHKGGPTSTINGTLLCGYHHRMYEKLGWKLTSINGVPAWIPPPWIDPDQVPRRNSRPGAMASGPAGEPHPRLWSGRVGRTWRAGRDSACCGSEGGSGDLAGVHHGAVREHSEQGRADQQRGELCRVDAGS